MQILFDGAGGPVPLGTGTLFDINGRSFLICARHLFDGMSPSELARVCLPEAPEGGVFRIGQMKLLRPEDEEAHFDIAAIEILNSDLLQRLRRGWRFVGLAHAGEASPTGLFLLAGYPSVFTENKDGRVNGGIATIASERVPPPAHASHSDDPYVEGADLFFRYERAAMLIDGSEIESPRLLGASGGPVWEYSETSAALWTPEAVLKIIGIQSSELRGRHFRAKSWAVVRNLLELEGAVHSGITA